LPIQECRCHPGQVLVMVAPGQGAQNPGFLAPWLEEPQYADQINWLSAVCGLDLSYYGVHADADAIRDTAVAQPLLVAAGLLAARALFADTPAGLDLAAGHSVGEITVAASVGVITAEQAMVLVRERGRAMARTAAESRSGMAAVVGGRPGEVADAIEAHHLTTVNNNGPGQVVAAGPADGLTALMADPPRGARVIRLEIAGAFHTKAVQHVADLLGCYARSIAPLDPGIRLLSNRDGQVVSSGRDALARIAAQVSSPVYWNLCMQTMADLGVTGMLEIPPAGTLTRIARRALPSIETFALNTPDQLDEARAFIGAHASQ
jgi:[acyl-carrier-protein] S-malonyltransferase